MSIDYTTDSLVALVKRRGAIPTSQQLFTTSDIVNMANDEMRLSIVPLIMSVREDYFRAYTDTALVSGQTTYDIPSDSIGMKLRNVSLVKDGVLNKLPRLSVEELENDSKVQGVDISDHSVVLNPSPTDTSISIRMYYMRRPLKLTVNTLAGQVTAIDTATNILTLSFVPPSWAAADTLNSVKSIPPFNTTNTSMTVSAASSPTVTVDDVTGVTVGDWVSAEGETVIPQILEEAHGVLAQAVTVKILEALGDREGMKAAEVKLEQNKKDLLIVINPRVDGSPKKIVGRGILDV